MIKQTYSILQREVNKSTGQIAVRVCKKGTQDFISGSLNYCRLRSIFNE